jgi:hypothetical protein
LLLVGSGLYVGIEHGTDALVAFVAAATTVALVFWAAGSLTWMGVTETSSAFWWLAATLTLPAISAHALLWHWSAPWFLWIIGSALVIISWLLAGRVWRDFLPRLGYTVLFAFALGVPLVLTWAIFWAVLMHDFSQWRGPD